MHPLPPEPHLVMVPTKIWFLWWTSGPDLNAHEQNRKLTVWRRPLLWWSPQFSRPGSVACATPCSQKNSLSSGRVQDRGRPCQWLGVCLFSSFPFFPESDDCAMLMGFTGKGQKVTFQEEPWWNWSSRSKALREWNLAVSEWGSGVQARHRHGWKYMKLCDRYWIRTWQICFQTAKL